MTRLLVAYDGSEAARAALGAAGELFPHAAAQIAFVAEDTGAFARAALPAAAVADLRAQAAEAAAETVAEGVELAEAAGLRARGEPLAGTSPWRALLARAGEADVLVCGAGSTASALVHHADRPLLVAPAGTRPPDGALMAGFDDSAGARAALRFAAEHLPDRRVIVAHAWRSPVRHTLRGHAFMGSGVELLRDYAGTIDEAFAEVASDVAEEGADYARSLGLRAQARAVESGRGHWQALVHGARDCGATALLVGTRGRGAVAATVLGSVTSGLVHAGALPVLIVPAR